MDVLEKLSLAGLVPVIAVNDAHRAENWNHEYQGIRGKCL